ncbi:unnamed protein product [Anisakis simplex]|uniref:Na_H_Exchanger domain-containing protein n=1 Tax=Anisakis simplex TaxID=6269 RepID=A0A0M3JD79_ANISI|nr:unnamed protein product [Anisakis simplex]
MLVTGVILRNTGVVQLFLLKEWAMVLRKTAFVVILLRGGLGLDSDALNRLKGACLRLSFIPCSVEATVIAISSHFILKFPWLFAFALGFVSSFISFFLNAVIGDLFLRLEALLDSHYR